MNIKGILTYDGTSYSGFQKTKTGKSIEEALEKALFQILRKKTYLQVASRTDAGVHAKGQVINFFAGEYKDLDKLLLSLNAVLPGDIKINSLEKERAFFHPSLDCKKKTYSYHLCTGKFIWPHIRKTCWHYPYKNIDKTKMQKGANYLIGTRDFSAFTTGHYENPRCTIEKIEIIFNKPDQIKIYITGDRFLYKMARTIVGTLVSIATGDIVLSNLDSILKHQDRKMAGLTAPSLGLCLEEIMF